ncbi:Conserved_hypothetical protein [Hexamita inflata]|uniref:Uncharacterized protein n=1 Tax=Hexamita inflata TaxID=28002 RepID=A0ABP1H190_9EUKA
MGQLCINNIDDDSYIDENEEIAIHEHNFTYFFAAEYYAGVFIQKCIEVMKLNLHRIDQEVSDSYFVSQQKDNLQIHPKIVSETELIRLQSRQQEMYNFILENGGFSMCDSKEIENVIVEDSTSVHMPIHQIKPLKVNKLTYTQIVELLLEECPYLSEFDIFQILQYLQYENGTILTLEELTQKFKQGKLDETLYDVNAFIRLAYLCSPDQFKLFQHSQIYILFFAQDLYYSGNCYGADVNKAVCKHFGQNNKLRLSKITTLQEFELLAFNITSSDIPIKFSNVKVKKYIAEYKHQLHNLKHELSKTITIAQKKFQLSPDEIDEALAYSKVVMEAEVERQLELNIGSSSSD